MSGECDVFEGLPAATRPAWQPVGQFSATKTGPVLELTLYGYISADPGDISAAAVLEALQKHKSAGVIRIFLNSEGGAVFEALAIHSALRRHGARIEVFVDGMALSAGSIIAMAGDDIAMAAGSLMMVHEVRGSSTGTMSDLAKTVEAFRRLNDSLTAIYTTRSKKPESTVREWMAAETWFDAEQAVAAGLANRVLPARKAVAFRPVAAMQYTKVPPQALRTPSEESLLLQELRDRLPTSTAEFRVQCVEDGLTLAQAVERWQDRRIADLTASLAGAKGDPGDRPISEPDGDPVEAWTAAVESVMEEDGVDRLTAVARVATRYPAAHRRFLQATNPGHPGVAAKFARDS